MFAAVSICRVDPVGCTCVAVVPPKLRRLDPLAGRMGIGAACRFIHGYSYW